MVALRTGCNVQDQGDKFYMSYKLWRKWLCLVFDFFFWQPERNPQEAGNTPFESYTQRFQDRIRRFISFCGWGKAEHLKWTEMEQDCSPCDNGEIQKVQENKRTKCILERHNFQWPAYSKVLMVQSLPTSPSWCIEDKVFDS